VPRIDRSLTRTPRNGPSAPALNLVEKGILPDRPLRVLDYGCGEGDDCAWFEALGHRVDGWDPNPPKRPHSHRCSTRRPAGGRYDVVTMTYVLNVIEDAAERRDVIRRAWRKVAPGGSLIVTTRSPTNVELTGEPWRDGFLVKHAGGYTFQRGFDGRELLDLVAGLGGEAKLVRGANHYTTVQVRKEQA
jgi:DNA phosphorothioation-associated putative methyltransferase